MLVSYPFTVRRDNLLTKTFVRGSREGMISELSMFLSVEEGEVHHMPTYGVRKRDLLFSGEITEAKLGVLIMRISDKLREWFPPELTIEDAEVTTQSHNKVEIACKFVYNGEILAVGMVT